MTPLAQVIAVLEQALALLTDDPQPPADPNLCALDPLPCRTAVYLGGEVPWDTCGGDGCRDRDGMLWAKLVSIDPTAGGSDAGNCATYTWTAEVGIVRCVHTLSDSGQPPTPEQIAADADQQSADADAIFAAFRCCPARPESIREVALSRWNPLGPSGGCAGGAWTVRGRLDACC